MFVFLFFVLQEYKESPRRERVSHSERTEDRHGLPSTEDHLSSDSEGRRPRRSPFDKQPVTSSVTFYFKGSILH